jgi:hypothetical protein
MQNPDIHHNFHTPLSQQEANEIWHLNQLIEQAQQNQQENDVWGYIWGNTQYTPNRFYTINFRSIEAPEPFKWIWKARVTKKT